MAVSIFSHSKVMSLILALSLPSLLFIKNGGLLILVAFLTSIYIFFADSLWRKINRIDYLIIGGFFFYFAYTLFIVFTSNVIFPAFISNSSITDLGDDTS